MEYKSVENPPEYSGEKADCTVHAVAVAAGMPYGAAHEELRRAGRKNRRGHHMTSFLQSKWWKLANYDVVVVPPEQMRPTVGQFVQWHREGRFIVTVRRHAFAVVDGVAYNQNKAKQRVVRAWRLVPR